MNEYKVTEIFRSIDGEGKYAGLPATFIRLYGCNLRCSYCDTRFSYNNDDYTVMTLEQIMDKVKSLEVKHITLTGGEPLIHDNINELITTLADNDYIVNIETNGTIIPEIKHSNVFYTMDFKTLSSDMSDKMNYEALNMLNENDVLKFVVSDEQDLEQTKQVLNNIKSQPQVYYSSVFNQIQPKEIVEFIINNKLFNCRVQVQLHKIIWDPNERGV